MATQTYYRATRVISVNGRQYRPGDALDDPSIEAAVLSRLAHNNKVALANRYVPDDGEASPAHWPGPRGAERTTPPGDAEAAGDGSGDGDTDAAGDPDMAPWRAAWQARGEDEQGQTLRQWLLGRSRRAGLSGGGSVRDLVERLSRNGIEPDAAGH